MACWKPINIAFNVTEPTKSVDNNLPPIILLHALTVGKEHWDNVAQSIADATSRKVYKLDARNHGDSDWNDTFDFDVLSNDVNHFMETHNIPKAILIGHSMGGRTAMEVAGKHKEKVEKLIIEDMTPKAIEKEGVEEVNGLIELYKVALNDLPKSCDVQSADKLIKEIIVKYLPEENKTEQTMKYLETINYSNDLKKTDQGLRWKMNINVIQKSVQTILDEFKGHYDGDSLFIYGTKSSIKLMDDKDLVIKKFPKSVFKGVEGADHNVHQLYPNEFLRIVIDYIKKS